MNITTDELIKVMKNNPMQEGRGRLCGRLDIIEEEMKFFDDSWIQNSENRIANENWQIVQNRLQWLKTEKNKIKDALSASDEKEKENE